MRTATSLLAALTLTACGATAPEYALDTQGIARDIATPDVLFGVPEFDGGVAIVTVEGLPRLDDRDMPTASTDPENRQEAEQAREDAPEEPGTAGETSIDRAFDPEGYCETEPAERACPSAEHESAGGPEITERQLEQLAALQMACEAWMERGPASYAMVITETWMSEESEERAEIDATVCTGATVDAFDMATEQPIDPTTVASVDNLYWAAAEHVIQGEEIQVRVDPNLSYITSMTIATGEEETLELFELTAQLRPIGPQTMD